jgi:hypothetical protein
MNLEEDENQDEEHSESKSHTNANIIRPSNQRTTQVKRHQKKTSKLFKKSKHASKKTKYISKSQRDLSGTELAISLDKQAKEHFLYKPFYSLPDLTPYVGEIIEVRVAAEFLSSLNKAYVENRIWGSDIYTSDSDMVCVLQHSGYYNINDYTPTEIEGLSIYLRVSKGRAAYNSSLKNGVRSKKLNNYHGHSIKVEGFSDRTFLGTEDELKSMAARMPSNSEYKRKKPNPQRLADNMYYTEFNMVFNLSFEMWLAYSLPAICDKGRDFKDFTSYRLKKNVLYIETSNQRFEISLNFMDHNNDDYLFEEYETYKIAEVLDPIEKDNDFMREEKIPLDDKYVKVLFNMVDWHDLLWGENSLKIKDFEINGIKCFNYYQKFDENFDREESSEEKK